MLMQIAIMHHKAAASNAQQDIEMQAVVSNNNDNLI